ncbi:hypothetical protein [Variovorax sp. HW608]|uniref:hypothetical protein n=1 Tax=Variovorax sp. HW608 TaxID=1034889 RepID=UPI000B5ACDAD|nr:hypothetical protein [Variovorax sp. HW608]
MSDRDGVVVNDDLLDEQPDDALSFQNVQILHLHAQAFKELAQCVSEAQINCLIGQLASQRFDFRLQPCLALAQLGHASA